MPKKHIITIIIISILFILALPLMLEHFIFRNEVYSVLTNGEWGSFLGSYIGGALGGIGTLLAVYITTKQTRNIQKDTLQQIKEDREIAARNERKMFADEVSGIIAKYIAEISVYFYGCRTLEKLDSDRYNAKSDLHRIEREIARLYEIEQQNDDILPIEIEINQLKQNESVQRYKIENIEKDIAVHRVNRIVANECYFLLQMKLQGINQGKAIIEQLTYIHNNCSGVKNTSLEWIEEETQKLRNMTVRFIEKYVDQKII